MRHIPNIITSLNLISGFTAILYALGGDLLTASWLILAAMIFDFLDGFSARLLGAYSELGKELDSLADMVSFGVAPAVIIHLIMKQNAGAVTHYPQLTRQILLFIPVIMPLCAGLRLAIFNVDTRQTTSFRGLPTPANAIAVISLVIVSLLTGSHAIKALTSSVQAMALITVTLSLLMVTRIPLLSLKTKHLRFRGNEGRYLMAALILIAFIVLGIRAATLVIPLYIVASLVSLLIKD
ncbi:MAG: CDP-diacylglycerol--serine O-phosphatidyltransferase [Bacteroidales bacterium]|jgi:CDP-diacylglycerol--serine O-phosphatidyltransferase|nr:CDP-diacylglycerol--serine O-phosphatidyltransferase [Bacteroidales bacterium]